MRERVKRSRGRLQRATAWGGGLLAVGALLALTISVGPAFAASFIYVTTTTQDGSGGCSLGEAIIAANTDSNSHAPECTAGSGADTIVLLPPGGTFVMSAPLADYDNYTGPTATPMVQSEILIEALGAKIVHYGGGLAFRAFAVGHPIGHEGKLTIREAHIKGFEVRGGDGRVGGAGGLGAGGAVYVHGGTLTVERSTFEQNGALGGGGSAGSNVVGGGGGGLGGDGGAPFVGSFAGGGGGGGASGDGGRGDRDDFAGGAGGGGGGTVEDGESGDNDLSTGTGQLAGGSECGGAGGHTDVGLGSDDGSDGCTGGGGGGGESYRPVVGLVGNGDGGTGGYGGGGGGAGYSDGSGGDGGFGGGGGGGTTGGSQLSGLGPNGGDGGFGGGGGSGVGGYLAGGPGQGGTFAGDGDEGHGGGGAGLGGAIFGHEATITVRNSTFFNNYANRGHYGGGDSNDGRGAGGAIFLVAGSLTVLNSTISGNATGEFTTGVGGLGGGGIVVYKPTTGQATSLTLRNTIVAGNGPHECYLRNGASISASGNLIVANTANIRGDTPCSPVAQTGDPQLGPLTVHFPSRTPTMAIPATSPAIDAADQATALQIDQRGVLRPAGFADIGAHEAVDPPPVTTIELTPASPNGDNDWYRGDPVGVTITATDDGGVAQTRCALDPATAPATFADLPDAACSLTSVGSDGQHTIFAASVDANGNAESPPVSVAFKVDRTAPTLSPTLSSNPVQIGQMGVTASPNASDETSGVASSSCGAVDTSTPGVKTVTCTATDNAGNTADVDLDYVVEYRILGFFEPVPSSKWKVRSTVPIKVALGDGAGTRISDEEGAALASSCRVRFSASGAQTKTAECMKYDAAKDQFVYTWKLGKNGTGAATITVTVTYPGSSSTTQQTLSITITP